MMYLNYLLRNTYPSSVLMQEGKGHVLDVIPKYLTLSQAHEWLMGKNIEISGNDDYISCGLD